MSRSLQNMPVETYCNAAQAVLEHHFDNHQFCGLWCCQKDASQHERDGSAKYYRCHETSAELYKTLQEKLSWFVTLDWLIEISHGMDTNINESFNNTATWFAPKKKVYCGSISLSTCLSLATGISSVGFEGYFKRIFKKLGIVTTNNMSHFFKIKDARCSKRLHEIRTKEHEQHRNKLKFQQLKEHTIIAKQERAKWDPSNWTAQNLDEINDNNEDDRKPPARKKVKRNVYVCPHPFCGLKGHLTTKSKKCKANPEMLPAADATIQAECEAVLLHAAATAPTILLSTMATCPNIPAAAAVAYCTTHANDDADDIDTFDLMPFDAFYCHLTVMMTSTSAPHGSLMTREIMIVNE